MPEKYQLAANKPYPFEHQDWSETAPSNGDTLTVTLDGLHNGILVESDQPIYVSLAENRITSWASLSAADKRKRLKVAANEQRLLGPQEREFDKVYVAVQSAGTAAAVTITPIDGVTTGDQT